MSSTGQYQTVVSSGASGNIYISSNFGVTFTAQGYATDFTSVCMSSSGKYQSATYKSLPDGAILISSNYGANWTFVFVLSNYIINSICMSSSGQYQSIVSTNGIYISSNYGGSWTLATVNNSVSICMSANGQYQTAVNSSQVYKSTNYGVSWNNITSPGLLTYVCMSADGQYQTSCSSGYIYISSDYGVTWTPKNNSIFRSWVSICMSSNGQYQTAVDNTNAGFGNIHLSSDYGENWTPNTNNYNYEWKSICISASGEYISTVDRTNIWISSMYLGPISVNNISTDYLTIYGTGGSTGGPSNVPVGSQSLSIGWDCSSNKEVDFISNYGTGGFNFYNRKNPISRLTSMYVGVPATSFANGIICSIGNTDVSTGYIQSALKFLADGGGGYGSISFSMIQIGPFLYVVNQAGNGVYLSGSSWAGTSDERLKTNITPLSNSLSSILKLKPKNYQFISDIETNQISTSLLNNDQKTLKIRSGFIAQDIQTDIPELVNLVAVGPNTMIDKDGKEYNPLSVNMTEMIPYLVKSIQEIVEKGSFQSVTGGTGSFQNLNILNNSGNYTGPTGTYQQDIVTHSVIMSDITLEDGSSTNTLSIPLNPYFSNLDLLNGDFVDTYLKWTKRNIGFYKSICMSANGQYQTSCRQLDIFRSNDYGKNWNNVFQIGINGSLCMSASGQYQSCISNGIYISNNYGENWIKKSELSISTINTYEFDTKTICMSASGQYQACISDNSIYISNNYGENWNKSSLNANLVTICMSASGQYITTAKSDEYFYSTNYGKDWTNNNRNGEYKIICMSANGRYQTLVDVQYYNNHYKICTSNNYGKDWVDYIINLLESKLSGICMSASGKYQIITNYNSRTYHLSIDYGNKWTRIKFDTEIYNTSCICMSANAQYISLVTNVPSGLDPSTDPNYGGIHTTNMFLGPMSSEEINTNSLICSTGSFQSISLNGNNVLPSSLLFLDSNKNLTTNATSDQIIKLSNYPSSPFRDVSYISYVQNEDTVLKIIPKDPKGNLANYNELSTIMIRPGMNLTYLGLVLEKSTMPNLNFGIVDFSYITIESTLVNVNSNVLEFILTTPLTTTTGVTTPYRIAIWGDNVTPDSVYISSVMIGMS